MPIRCAARRRGTSTTARTSSACSSAAIRNLKPQKSDPMDVGAVFEPISGVSTSAFDWFNLDLEEPVQQRRHAVDDPRQPGAVRQPDHARSGAAAVSEHPRPDHPHRPALHQYRRGAGSRASTSTSRSGRRPRSSAASPATSTARTTSSTTCSSPTARFLGGVSNSLRGGHDGLSPRYKQYATVTWDARPVDGNARQPVPELVHRRPGSTATATLAASAR